MAVIRYLRYLLAVLGVATLVAAAPAPTKTVGRFKASRASPTCVTGVPAVRPSDGSFPIPYYAIVTPAADGTGIASHYKLDSTWFKAHVMSDAVGSIRPMSNCYWLLTDLELLGHEQLRRCLHRNEVPVFVQCRRWLRLFPR